VETTIKIAVVVTRNKGAFRSSDAITDEIIALLDGQILDVEDSEYEVVSVARD